jgi:3-deoxy-manno-octulosonate cytidylyltransferase (CMP-KDO synthetase)
MVDGQLLKEVFMHVVGLIPSRLNSARLPSKALLNVDGLPLVVHTMKRAQLSESLDDVYVCTDSEKIGAAVIEHGGKCIMTSSGHINGTERIAEASKGMKVDLKDEIRKKY